MIDRADLKSIPILYRSVQLYRYLTFQPRLAAAALRDRLRSPVRDGLPIPPAKLRYRVHGGLDPEGFLRNGRTITRNIRELLASVGRDLGSFEAALDFGCGSGRILRNLIAAPDSLSLHGTDIDPELVEWCRDNLPGVDWSTNSPLPPTGYEDRSFDLIWAISVFTHLDEDYQDAWLDELARIARPGAILILSIHGEHVYRTLAPSEQERLREHGFLFLQGATGRLKLDGLPDFYQSAYHTREYIERAWTGNFEVLRYAERAINDHQDAVVLRR